MSFFTAHDRTNLKRLVDQHKVIHRRNSLLARAPHIGSHTVLRVQTCTDEYEYYDPIHMPPADDDQRAAMRDLEDLAIVADWKFTAAGCDAVVSCNPFYPPTRRCRGMAVYERGGTDSKPAASDAGAPPDHAFSFRTLSVGQSFDACQPVCYDPAVDRTNMVGVTSRFAFGKCRVYDPLVQAFYLDPSRRYVNPDTQILERQAYAVRDALIEPYGDAALLASIPSDYCDQYGEKYEPDGREHGVDMYKCGEHAVVWSTSWLFGDTLPRLALLSYDKLFRAGGNASDREEMRYPPSQQFLTSREAWLRNVAPGKRRLPFPLRLSALGIRRGTVTEWLVWTDEFAHLKDGKNDSYGGRLVERDRPVTHAVNGLRDRSAAAALAAFVRSTTAGGRLRFSDKADPSSVTGLDAARDRRHGPDGHSEFDSELVAQRNAEMLKSLEMGAGEFNKVLSEDLERDGADGLRTVIDLGAGITYGVAYGYLAHKLEWPTVTSVLKGSFNALRRAPSYARRVPVKAIGYWAAESAAAHAFESIATRGLVSRLKTLAMAQVLGPVALVVDVIALIGMAVDITFVLLNAFGVSTPISRRENFVSDRRLYRLAQAEIEFNRRMYGVGNIELTPYRFVINTPYLRAGEDVEPHLTLMPIVYAARQLNSDGGLLRPTSETSEATDYFHVDKNGNMHYSKDGAPGPAAIRDEEGLASAADSILQPKSRFDVLSKRRHDDTSTDTAAAVATSTYYHYYFIVSFIAIFLVGYFYPNRYWTIAVALLASVLSVLQPATE